ncbi:hypothetical protein AJ80_04150 [Polytolypa hystricis UAMH7299]|uniref:Uncharacterized protein n=1 Tax=Polytolypa hystricis (strain UAMH7299) TaxID=1447883 RepID=A0A2B7YDP8_POLH7|nr:hypothetical protein AJ80_04150 [Polytolypa hystricis UAMH7299]
MTWSFSFSLWVVNGAYESDYNGTAYIKPNITEIDDCGPDNLISAGYALWLVLVPAVACVVQLPGSLFLFRRSNFYRFSPELGLVDCFAVLTLIVKALWNGFRWDESIAAVFTVRDGIGRGDLWWRKDLRELSRVDEQVGEQDISPISVDSSNGRVDAAGGSTGDGNDSSNDASASNDDRIHEFLTHRFAPILAPLSHERVLGAALFLTSFIKAMAMIKASSNSGVRLCCSIALAYSTSYLVLEILAWSYVFPLRHNNLKDIPPENLLDVVRLVDPGDNPFTFPDVEMKESLGQVIPLGNLVSLRNPASSSATPVSTTTTTTTASFKRPWNITVALIAASLGLLGPLGWMLILSNIWNPARGAWILAVSAFAFLVVRLLGKKLYQSFCRYSRGKSQNATPSAESGRSQSSPPLDQQTSVSATATASDPFVQYNTHGVFAFFLIWLWRRITVVNLYSAIWVVVICYYFAWIFPVKAGITPEDSGIEVPQKPVWLEWLG